MYIYIYAYMYKYKYNSQEKNFSHLNVLAHFGTFCIFMHTILWGYCRDN